MRYRKTFSIFSYELLIIVIIAKGLFEVQFVKMSIFSTL